MPQIEAAFSCASFWRVFVPKTRAASIKPLDTWLDKMDPVISWQFARRGWSRPANMPLSTGGLEQRARVIRDAIHPRRYTLKNRERLNRLLMLMQLHANGDESELQYSTAIRDWLVSNDGRPRGQRRAVADRKGSPSLR